MSSPLLVRFDLLYSNNFLPNSSSLSGRVMLNTLPAACAGHMTDLLFMEKDLVTSLKEYIRAEEDKLAQIKQ